MFDTIAEYGHEKIVYCYEPDVNLRAIIGVHSTALGPAVGGCRMRKYATDEEALFDVMRLSRGMSLKNAAANLGVGGGKSVIIADPFTEKTPELLIAFAEAIESLGGIYWTAEDVGMSVDDLNLICRHTKYAMGGTENPYGLGDPSLPTAYGAFLGIKAGAEIKMGITDLSGVKVALQGVGNVGTQLCGLLTKAGADVTVTDVNTARVENAVKEYGVKAVAPDDIYDVDCDIFTPAAFGGSINENTIPRLTAKLVVGPANNQLLKDSDAVLLAKRDIYFIPDFIVSCGGVTMGTAEMFHLTYDEAFKKIEIVTSNVHEVDQIARTRGITTNEAALEMSWGRIRATKAAKKTAK
ncbi:Leu/Phe/Val dehydrogenase [Anaerotruncus rubiinfantis]|uniref:Leu/Phe/Val dehydrogenase n=1 Tax=Anaerotruncus rubiinfantis TaxID=1720200 RepID=UPI00082979B6|nr:Glu/Leu/Phe/Val dehydrogenase dimerization domain-containing protein [Anaerotruncus rubiinfantis]